MNNRKKPSPQRPNTYRATDDVPIGGDQAPENEEWEVVTAPGWKPKEMSLGTPAWVVRFIIAALAVIMIGEMFFLFRFGIGGVGTSMPAEQTVDSVADIYAERPTPTIAPPPPTATAVPQVESSESVVIDKSF